VTIISSYETQSPLVTVQRNLLLPLANPVINVFSMVGLAKIPAPFCTVHKPVAPQIGFNGCALTVV